jgi:hypothetical protein
LKNVEADTPKGKHVVDPPRDGIGAHRIAVNAVNAANGGPRGGETGRSEEEGGGRAAAFWRFPWENVVTS